MEDVMVNLAEAERKRLRTKKILVIVVVVFILIVASGSFGGYRLHQNYLKEERDRVDSIQVVLDEKDLVYDIRFQEGIDSVQSLTFIEDNYYDEMVKYYNLSERLQDEVDAINILVIEYERLDSLARHIRYPGTKRN